MKEDRLYDLTEAFLAGSLRADERAELEALTAEPAAAEELAAQVRLSRALATVLAPRSLADAWPQVEALLAGDADRAERMAERVAREIKPRRWPFLLGGAVLAAAGLALLLGRPRPPERQGQVVTRTVITPEAPAAPIFRPDALVEGDEVVFAFDPARHRGMLAGGRIARCPPGLAAGECIAGERFSARYREVVGMKVADFRVGLFDWEPGLLLTFDYWLGETTGREDAVITAWYHDRTLRGSHGLEDHHAAAYVGVVRGRWAHRILPLDAIPPQLNAPPPRPGDRIDAFDITGRYTKEDIIFLANIKIVRSRP